MWRIEYDNDVCRGFREWWNVTDGNVSFRADTEEDAKWLADKLNEKPQNQPDE